MNKLMTIFSLMLISLTGHTYECSPSTQYKRFPNPIPGMGAEYQYSHEKATELPLAYDCQGVYSKSHICVYLDQRSKQVKFEGVVHSFNKRAWKFSTSEIKQMNLYDIGPEYFMINNSLFSVFGRGELAIKLLSVEDRGPGQLISSALYFNLDHHTSIAKMDYQVTHTNLTDSEISTDEVNTMNSDEEESFKYLKCSKK